MAGIKMCPAPFLSQAMWADGRASVCCNDESKDTLGLEEEWYSSSRRLLRQEWLAGNIPTRCVSCIGRNENSESELYNHYVHLYGHMSRYQLIKASKEKPKYLHLSPSNKCNVGCRICDSFISSTYGKLFSSEEVTNIPIVEWVKGSPVEHYYAHGGEPLLSPEHKEVIRYFTTLPNPPHVTILTNGTVYDEEWVELLKKIPSVLWQISLDGHPELNDVARVGTRTKLVEKNWWKVREALPHAKFSIHSTFSIYNSHDLEKTYQYINSYKPDAHSFCIGHNPGRISVSNLSDIEKDKLRNELMKIPTGGSSVVEVNLKPTIENILLELDRKPRNRNGYVQTTLAQNSRLANEKLLIDVKDIS